MEEKQTVASFINRHCTQTNCFACEDAGRFGGYKNCSCLTLKQMARKHELTADDIPDSLVATFIEGADFKNR